MAIPDLGGVEGRLGCALWIARQISDLTFLSDFLKPNQKSGYLHTKNFEHLIQKPRHRI